MKQSNRNFQMDSEDISLFVNDPVADLEKEMERQFKSDMKSIIFIASCVLAFFLVVWGTLP